MRELKKLSFGKRYRLKRKFYIEAPPLRYFAEKGEIVVFKGKSLGYAHLEASDGRLVLMSKKEAFDFLEEVEDE